MVFAEKPIFETLLPKYWIWFRNKRLQKT